MSEHQRRIELQSPGDLSYLLENVRTAARHQIDLHLPPSAAQGEDDAYRAKINDLVQQYINDTWQLAVPSLSINGLDASSKDLLSDAEKVDSDQQNYEPFDTRLAQRLGDLYRTVEEETTRVAEMRREAPKKGSSTYIDALKKVIEADDADFATRQSDLQSIPIEGLADVKFADHDATKKSWDQSRKDLEELRNVTKVKAGLERAIRAANEVEKR